MSFLDILRLSLRNLQESKLRALLTTMGVIVGVAVIVTMVSFGLGLQRNTLSRFKALDLFNEITVFGRTLTALASKGPAQASANTNSQARPAPGNNRGGPRGDGQPESSRNLDDAAITEIQSIPGVSTVEPNITFTTFVRSNNRSHIENISGALVPNPATRFKEYLSGGMIGSPNATEVLVNEEFLRDFGYSKPEDAVGHDVELLSSGRGESSDEGQSFFGIPLGEGDQEQSEGSKSPAELTLKVAGILKDAGSGPRVRGFSLPANVIVPLSIAKQWRSTHSDELGRLALSLARENGALTGNESAGYQSATVRVEDPIALTNVRKRLSEMGFTSFSIMDQLEQLRVVFLIMDSVLGLLGGISLLVASFGIANTMIMSILERTREIGIMKAIGAEDLEIKMIFFVEAAFIGLVGGSVGCVVAVTIDAVANRLAYRFVLKPQSASFIDFFALPVWLWTGAIVFAIAISIIAALYPATRAAAIDPVKALRHD